MKETSLQWAYLDEATERANESIHSYNDDKGDEGFGKQQLIWGVIDERWIYLNRAFSYSCGFIFHVKVMDGFFTCVQRIVPFPVECTKISKEMEIYRMTGGTFSFDIAVVDRKTKMPCKL